MRRRPSFASRFATLRDPCEPTALRCAVSPWCSPDVGADELAAVNFHPPLPPQTLRYPVSAARFRIWAARARHSRSRRSTRAPRLRKPDVHGWQLAASSPSRPAVCIQAGAVSGTATTERKPNGAVPRRRKAASPQRDAPRPVSQSHGGEGESRRRSRLTRFEVLCNCGVAAGTQASHLQRKLQWPTRTATSTSLGDNLGTG